MWRREPPWIWLPDCSMRLEGILTQRRWEKRVSFDLIYAWEEIFARELGIPLVPRHRMVEAICRRLPGHQSVPTGRKNLLLTEMNPMPGENAYNRVHVVPYWVDFFLREPSLPKLVRSYNGCPAIFVSSREAFEFLVEQDTGLPLHHLALSLPDGVLCDRLPEKAYDVALMGRPDAVLSGFFQRYVGEHACTFVYRKMEKGRFLYFDQAGNCLGDMDNYDKYIDLMRRCRVGLYATPGLDPADGRTQGFSQVTPRFLEYLSAGCHVLMRYKSNPDTDFFELGQFCPSVDTYEVFESKLTDFLYRPADMNRYRDYLARHTTSARAREMQRILSRL